MADPPDTGEKQMRGERRPRPNPAINTTEQLKALIRDWENWGLMDIINNLQSRGMHLTSGLYKELQDRMLKAEAKTGVPVSVQAGTSPLSAEMATALSGGGGGGGGSGGGGGGGAAAAMTPEEEFYWWQQQQDYENRLAQEEEARQRAAEAEQRAWQAEQERVQREWEAQQAEIERQNRLRLQRLGDLTNLVGQFAGIQARARETLAGLQGDAFKFAAAKQGLAPQGVTPVESFGNELTALGNRPMPTIDPNAPLSAIEQQIMGLQGQMAPQAPRIFGMAGGGQVSGAPQTVLVGEQGPEIVMGSDFKVVPLTASAASGYDTDSLLPALAPLYAGLGMGSVPKANALYAHNMGTPVGFRTGGNIGALGYNPRLIRDQQSGATYYRNDAGQLQHIRSPEDFTKFGFNWKDVYNVDDVGLPGGGDVPFFGGIGPGLGNKVPPLMEKPGVPIGMPPAFGPLSSPIIEPVTGAILPAPYRAAAFLNQMRLQNPQLYQLALSAYANSMTRPNDPNSRLGYTQEGVEAEVRQALPFGQEHGLIGLR